MKWPPPPWPPPPPPPPPCANTADEKTTAANAAERIRVNMKPPPLCQLAKTIAIFRFLGSVTSVRHVNFGALIPEIAADGEIFLAALQAQLLRRQTVHFIECAPDRLADSRDRNVRCAMGAAGRLGHDAVDDLELKQILRRDAQRGCDFLRLLRRFLGALVKDRGAGLRRDHRIDR